MLDADTLNNLQQHGLDHLTQEPRRLEMQAERIDVEIKSLSTNNYSVYIQNHDCVGHIRTEIKSIRNSVDSLVGALEPLNDTCKKFRNDASDIVAAYKRNRQTMEYHGKLMDLLELPQIMDMCVRNDWNDEALNLLGFAKQLERRHPPPAEKVDGNDRPARQGFKIIHGIVKSIRTSATMMRGQLLKQLRSQIQLPQCLQIVGHLRRLDLSLNTTSGSDGAVERRLRMEFLECRDIWLQQILQEIPSTNPYQFLLKLMEKNRMYWFDIITQYKAIFAEDAFAGSGSSSSDELLSGWVLQKVVQFLAVLENKMAALQDVASLANVVEQSMFFGASLGRVGADFRGLLPQIFEHRLLHIMQSRWTEASMGFAEEMMSVPRQVPIMVAGAGGAKADKTATAASPATSSSKVDSSDNSDGSPPVSLLAYPLLAEFCNALLSSFNELRLWAPLSLRAALAASLHQTLLSVARTSGSCYKAAAGLGGGGSEDGEGSTDAVDVEAAEELKSMAAELVDTFHPFIEACFLRIYPALEKSSGRKSLLRFGEKPPSLLQVEKLKDALVEAGLYKVVEDKPDLSKLPPITLTASKPSKASVPATESTETKPEEAAEAASEEATAAATEDAAPQADPAV